MIGLFAFSFLDSTREYFLNNRIREVGEIVTSKPSKAATYKTSPSIVDLKVVSWWRSAADGGGAIVQNLNG
jgi:hypothetical protein